MSQILSSVIVSAVISGIVSLIVARISAKSAINVLFKDKQIKEHEKNFDAIYKPLYELSMDIHSNNDDLTLENVGRFLRIYDECKGGLSRCDSRIRKSTTNIYKHIEDINLRNISSKEKKHVVKEFKRIRGRVEKIQSQFQLG